jgi:hypothetical protein
MGISPDTIAVAYLSLDRAPTRRHWIASELARVGLDAIAQRINGVDGRRLPSRCVRAGRSPGEAATVAGLAMGCAYGLAMGCDALLYLEDDAVLSRVDTGGSTWLEWLVDLASTAPDDWHALNLGPWFNRGVAIERDGDWRRSPGMRHSHCVLLRPEAMRAYLGTARTNEGDGGDGALFDRSGAVCYGHKDILVPQASGRSLAYEGAVWGDQEQYRVPVDHAISDGWRHPHTPVALKEAWGLGEPG